MDKLSYALGMSMGQLMVKTLFVKQLNFDDFLRGVKLMFGEDIDEMSEDEANELISEHMKKVNEDKFKKEAKEREITLKHGNEYLEKNSQKEGVRVTKSGLQYEVIKNGEGSAQPTGHSRVRVHYEGRLTGGKVFDSSFERGEPVEFGLEQVIPGWTEGLQLMKEGDVFEFTIPSQLGYGEVGVPGHIPGNSVLIFKVELIKVL